MQIIVKTLGGREIVLNVEGSEQEIDDMKVKIDNSRVKVRPAASFVIHNGKAIKKDFSNREKHAAGGGLSKFDAKRAIPMPRGGPKAKVLRKKMPTRTRVNKYKSMH